MLACLNHGKPLMIRKVLLAASLSASFVLSGVPAHASQLSMENKVALQATMFQHIDTMTIDGIIPHVTLDNGEVVDLVPTKAHPMFLALGDIYVLCSDFRDPAGNFVNVDFYVKTAGEKFVIFQTEINNRAKLEALMKGGKVTMLE